MLESVKAAVKRYNMFDTEKSVTVALSGGADSVALLVALLEIKSEYGLIISAAHLNHSLRGAESDGDMEFVKRLCEKLDVPLIVETADIKSEAISSKESIELAARRVRYDFLERVSPGLIATAHTASDNLETVLYNMSRGTSLHGLCGIPPVRGRVVRPLIFATRTEVEAFLSEKGFTFRTDSSNLSDVYSRNKLRLNAVPTLLEVNSAAVENVTRLCVALKEDEQFLDTEAEKALEECSVDGGLSVATLTALHPSIKRRVVSSFAKRELSEDLEHIHIEAVLNMSDNGVCRQSIKGGFSAVINNGVLKLELPMKPFRELSLSVDTFPFEYKNCTVNLQNADNFSKMENINNLSIENYLDYDKICGRLCLRTRLPGDKIRLPNRGCTKTFKNLFNERGLTKTSRDSALVLSDEYGVVWLSGFGVDERVEISEGTKNILSIKIKD